MKSWVSAKKSAAFAAALVLIAAGVFFYFSHEGRMVRVGDIKIDSKAAIDPNREYSLVVWEHEVPLPWDEGSHRAALEEAIAEFQQAWPNVAVDLRVLPWHEDHGQLREAIDQGNPPDVYGMPLGVRLIDAAWQIPIEKYLTEQTRADTLESALAGASAQGHAWAWPRWILPSLWIAREDLVPSFGADALSWTVDEFADALAEAQRVHGTIGLAANVYDPQLFVDVMVASTGKHLLGDDGRRAWSHDDIERGLAVFSSLIERGLTERDADAMSRTRLAKFWERQAAVVAPTTPWLMRYVLARGGLLDPSGGANPRSLRAAPPPGFAQREGAPPIAATLGGYAVFRQDPYIGHDHTRAAVALAEHLSRRLGPWEAARLLAVPAHPSSWERWREESGLPPREAELLREWVQHAVGSPLEDRWAEQQARAVAEVIGNELPRLWTGASPSEVADRMVAALDGLKAEVGHP